MMTSLFLGNVRHRAMIMPVSPPLTRLVHISSSYWIISLFSESAMLWSLVSITIVRLKLFSKWKLSIGFNFKSNVLYISIASKKHSVRYELGYLFSKKLNCISRQLGLWRMNPNKGRGNEVERTPATNDIVLFMSPATWTWKAGHETKIYEQWQGTKKRARVNN